MTPLARRLHDTLIAAALLVSAGALSAIAFALCVGTRTKQPSTNAPLLTPEPWFTSWFDYQTNWGTLPPSPWAQSPLVSERAIVLTSHINPHTSRAVIEQLLYLDRKAPGEPIEFRIRSTGGWLDDAFAIVDVMASLKSPVNIYAMGICDSAASVILASATGRRFAYPNALVGIHANMSPDRGRKFDVGDNRGRRFEAFWKSRAKLPANWFPLTANTTYSLTATEALEFGVIDEIVSPGR